MPDENGMSSQQYNVFDSGSIYQPVSNAYSQGKDWENSLLENFRSKGYDVNSIDELFELFDSTGDQKTLKAHIMEILNTLNNRDDVLNRSIESGDILSREEFYELFGFENGYSLGNKILNFFSGRKDRLDDAYEDYLQKVNSYQTRNQISLQKNDMIAAGYNPLALYDNFNASSSYGGTELRKQSDNSKKSSAADMLRVLAILLLALSKGKSKGIGLR